MIEPHHVARPLLLFAIATALACGDSTHPAEPEKAPREPSLQPSLRAMQRQELLARDRRLRESFTQIATGMMAEEVRQIMSVEPEVSREDLWEFPLSEASDTAGEKSWRLQVTFRDGVVAGTNESSAGVVSEPAPNGR